MQRSQWKVVALSRNPGICATVGSGESYLASYAPDNSLHRSGIKPGDRLIFIVPDEDDQTFFKDQICLIDTPNGVFAGPIRNAHESIQIGGFEPYYSPARWPRAEVRILGRFKRACPMADCNSEAEKLCWEPESNLFRHNDRI